MRKILLFWACALLLWGDGLKVAVMHTEPWGYYDQSGQVTGIWPEIADAIGEASGIAHTLRLTPYARALEGLRNGEADLSYLIRSPDREGEVYHAGFLFNFATVVIAHSDLSLTAFEDLEKMRIGVLRGIRISERFDQNNTLQKIEVRDYETMLGMLHAGRLDAVSGNSLSLPYLANQMKSPAQPSLGDRLVLQVTPVTVQFSHHHQDATVRARVERAVDALRKTGRIEAILNRYAGEAWRVD